MNNEMSGKISNATIQPGSGWGFVRRRSHPLLVALLLAGLVFSALAQIEVPITVAPVETTKTVEVVEQAQAATMRIRSINIMFRLDGAALVMTRWEWVDKDGGVVKEGMDRKTEAELVKAGVDVPALKGLFAAVAKASAEAPAE